METSSNPHRILVAEDDEDVRRLNADALVGSGYLVDAAEDGAVAWDSLQIKVYRLLITDNNMPKMSGIELIKKMRAASITTPVILASAAIPYDAMETHSPLQINGTLPKPYNVGELLKLVSEVLSGAVACGRL
jgi:DNA-binding response OmpR family regulator